MKIVASLAWVAFAFSAVPLSAQISTRDDRMRTRIPGIPSPADGRVSTRTGDARGDARVERASRGTSRVPPGHLPPRGMCRVWIHGVPPGQQPAVTDCATAQRQRLQHANARVIYGDEESFRGRANGRFDRSRESRRQQCSTRDAVVIGGRVFDFCGDEQARRGRDRDDDDDGEFDDDDDDDDDRRERASMSERKRQKEIEKARKRSGRGKGRG